MSARAYADDASPTLTATESWLETHLPGFVTACDTFSCHSFSRTYRVRDCRIEMTIDERQMLPPDNNDNASDLPYYVVQLFPRSGLQMVKSPIHENVVKGVVPDEWTTSGSLSVLLANVDTSRVKLDTWKVTAEPVDRSAALLELSGTNGIRFATLDADLASRIREALLHAAKLCGATNDTF